MRPNREDSSGKLSGLLLAKPLLLAVVGVLLTFGGEAHAQPSVPPDRPAGLTATSVTHNSVTLSWDDPGLSSITGYQVLRRSRDGANHGDGNGAAEFVVIEGDTGTAATSYTDTSVTPRTRYVYRVKAVNSAGTSGRSGYLNVETPEAPTPSAPAAPTGLAAGSLTHDSVTLTWDDPGDDSITGYQVLRRPRDGDEHGDGEGASGFAVIVDDTGSSDSTYTDTSVTPRTRYVYRVKAVNPVGVSGRSGYLNVATLDAPAPAVPAAPTGLAASSLAHDSVTLTWDDPGDDSITGYEVLRRSRDGDEYGDGLGASEFAVIVDDTGTPATTHTDTSVAAHTRYVYRVRARNPQGLSESSSDADAETSEDPAPQRPQPCTEDYVPPTPTEVAVRAVPIVVESTTADYFVLYAGHDANSATVEYPVQVVLGEDGTTTLSENVAALPVERYRVEKYAVANPADVDGDCIDDITELSSPGMMNPVNPGISLELSDGAVALPDRETFETLAHRSGDGVYNLKFVVLDTDTERPSVYFPNAHAHPHHWLFLNAFDLGLYDLTLLRGHLVYAPELVAPDGSRGVYYYSLSAGWLGFSHAERVYTLLAAGMPLLHDNLAIAVRGRHLLQSQAELPLFHASRMNLVFDQDIDGGTGFQALNPGEGYGLLRSMDPDERPHSRDVVIYETLPNELPRVAGIISTVPQAPLSHVNLRAVQARVPNAFIADALEDDNISSLIDRHVSYTVTDDGYAIRAATQAEVDEHYASLRPEEPRTPQRDLAVTSITPLSDVGFDDWDSFGVKAANLAVLGTLGFRDGTVPDGFAVPFYFYDEFMKHNDLYDDVREMLADPDFQSDYDTKVGKLKKLRKKIKKAETPQWIETALTGMHAEFPEGTSLRYRSSTNNEDLPGFNGAGLYDSKTQHPEETEEDGISKSLKQVYASLWNFMAFIERDFHRIDHLAAAMGVLVHPNYSDELVNGVAVSTDPAYGTEGSYYVNSQVGEDLVTNPEAHSVPEEVLLHQDGTYSVPAFSNQAPRGQLLMTGRQLGRLRRYLTAIHERFADQYGVADGEEFAMEIEFKIKSDNVLAIKQARPWIFSASHPTSQTEATREGGLTASFEEIPATHDGTPFSFKIRFSEFVTVRHVRREEAVTVAGGRVTNVFRQDFDLWTVLVAPSSPIANISLALPGGRPCAARSAICTYGGQRLSNGPEHTVESLPPDVPDRPAGRVRSPDTVALEWNEVPRARSYELQFLHNHRWIDLPADGTEVEFDGAGAVVTGLPAADFHYFRVRAVNPYRASEWSDRLLVLIKVDWESEFTPDLTTDVSPVQSGFSALGDRWGVLSPDSIEIDGTTHGVRHLVHASGGLWLGLYTGLPSDFTLVVDGSAYHGRESMIPPILEGEGYWWPAALPDWSADEPVPVGLIVYPDVPLGDRQKAPVTGYFRIFPSKHDGHEDFSFRINFNGGVATTADALRDHALSVSGGVVSSVEAVGSEGRIWHVSVTPGSHEPVTVEIEADLDCALPGAVCSADGRRLFNRMELRVEPREKNPATGAPAISGTVQVGETLAAAVSGISDADGLTRATFSYQWVSYDGRVHADIEGATDSTYTLVPADEGRSFKVRVSFTDDAGNMQSLTSGLYGNGRPYGLEASESEGAVVLTWKLPAGWPGWSTFQVLRNRPEFGETEPLVHVQYYRWRTNTYTDTFVEPGVLYVYRVKGVDYFGVTGEASGPVEIRTAEPAGDEQPVVQPGNTPATGSPSIRGRAQVGWPMRVSLASLDDADGLNGATFSYQWQADGRDIAGATGPNYNPDTDDVGKAITVRVSFIDDAGNEETLTSAATAAVWP